MKSSPPPPVFSVVRSFAFPSLFGLVLASMLGFAHAVEDGELAKYWTADPLKVPYRAMVTPGREHGERLPLIVFLHGHVEIAVVRLVH